MDTSTPLDPHIREAFGWGDQYEFATIMQDPSLQQRLAASYLSPGYEPPAVPTREAHIDGPLGPESIRIRIYQPESSEASNPRPALVWSHGGGWLGGDLEMLEADGVARELVVRAGITVVSVEYHLANGSTVGYPVLHRDVAAAFQWVVQNADSFHVDATRVSIGGASAGASLSASVVLELLDNASPLPAALILAYPLLHNPVPRLEGGVELSALPQLLRLPAPIVSRLYVNYLAAADGDSRYATVQGHDLRGLPRTLVIPAEYDDLRGSAEAFSSEAEAAGVDVTRHLAAGAPHGHLNYPPTTLKETDRSLTVIADFITSQNANV